ncbi:hypothetical protein [Bartonella sp. AC130YNZD]|uniref:hypothetical protein n=1 Tax=Bartonella sp. AC130YNZD TaxID=3243445 RepID=UPI0035D02355
MVFMSFDPKNRSLALKRKKTGTELLQEGIDKSQRFGSQVPALPSMISMNNPYNIGSFSFAPIGSIRPAQIGSEENKPSPIPREEIPPSVGNHASVPTEQVIPQEQNSKPEPSFWDKLSRFSQSDVSKNIDDFLMGAITASPDSSGWQRFAKGLKNLHEGDKQRGQVNQTVEYLKSKGYSEEEARFIAGNKDALNAFLLQKVNGGNRNPQFTNDGRMLVEDPNAPGGYRYIMVEGGKSYEEAERAKALHANNIVRKSILLKDLTYLDEYLKEKGGYATGLIAWIKSIDMNVELFTRNLNQIRDVISRLSPEAKAYLLGEDASHSSANQSMPQENVENFPIVSGLEEANKMPAGSKVIYNNDVYWRVK